MVLNLGNRSTTLPTSGPVKIGRLTKKVITQLSYGSIAVICHKDLDETAAEGLLEAGAIAVINAAPSISGNYPARGALLLLEAGVPVCEIEPGYFSEFHDGEEVVIGKSCIHKVEGGSIAYRPLTLKAGRRQYEHSIEGYGEQLSAFVDNTLRYAEAEKDAFLKQIACPSLRTRMADKHALVVVRGRRHRQDLFELLSYVDRYHPVLIGVDGGADAFLAYGLVPDLIVGDMDSVSERALYCGAELLAHAYSDGRSPGLERLRLLGLDASIVQFPGTSEDLALLLAYEQQAEQIVAVGTHSSMVDFLGKGRQGMASTMLVRMKMGHKLIDAKGISLLTNSGLPDRRYSYADIAIGHYSGLE